MTVLLEEAADNGPIDVDAEADGIGAPVAVMVVRIVGAFSSAGRLLGVAFVYRDNKVESFVFRRAR